MSYDIRVWSVIEPEWVNILPESEGWQAQRESRLLGKSTWQIVVRPTLLVEDEDIPDEVLVKLPGIRYLTEVNLEPISAPGFAHDTLRRLVKRASKAAYAAVEDPQKGTVETARGVGRITRRRSDERGQVLNLAWWFNDGPVLQADGLLQLVNTMERLLPEALPRRYGAYEPPQYKYEEQGKERFCEFLAEERLATVWYPHYPFLHVWVGGGTMATGREGMDTRRITSMQLYTPWHCLNQAGPWRYRGSGTG
jgi:hypothetical protein